MNAATPSACGTTSRRPRFTRYEDINCGDVKGRKPFAGSVMDYIPVNIVAGADAAKKGDFGMIGIGPYDEWAIEYGYSFEKDLKPVLAARRPAGTRLRHG